MTGEYMYQEYPKWMYHQKRCPAGKIFNSEEELRAAGRDWVDTPAKFSKPSALRKALSAGLKWAGENWAKLATVTGTLMIVAIKTFFFS
ncbi:hypothetical protein ACL58G_09235 [Massilia sp. GER05]|uniref:hypothetical protein n=1 Tax=Massilia sp. GER05 TaxID=3394605 RepID=UPI003F82B87B